MMRESTMIAPLMYINHGGMGGTPCANNPLAPILMRVLAPGFGKVKEREANVVDVTKPGSVWRRKDREMGHKNLS